MTNSGIAAGVSEMADNIDDATKTKATEMVEEILSAIEKYGRIEGRKGNKHLVFSHVLSLRPGEPEPPQIYDRLVSYVSKNLKEFSDGK